MTSGVVGFLELGFAGYLSGTVVSGERMNHAGIEWVFATVDDPSAESRKTSESQKHHGHWVLQSHLLFRCYPMDSVD